MNTKIRFMKELDKFIEAFTVYDDESEDTVIIKTEDECYNILTRNEELSSLSEKVAREYIHVAYTDYTAYVNLMKQHNGFAY